MRTDFMASKAQIAWRKKFAKLYGKKKKGGKSSKTKSAPIKRGVNEPLESEYTGKWSRRYWKNKTKNVYAYIDFKNGKYYVITFRKNASPQWFKHKAMTLSEAQSYADGFNFQNK